MLRGVCASALAVLLLLGASAPDDLVAAAAASGRPPECMPARDGGRPRTTVWRLARVPTLGRYCRLLARAHAELELDPKGARERALEAERALPGRAAPEVVLGRAALRLGDVSGALEHFALASSRDARSFDDPHALRDLASSRRRAGKLEEARKSYELLVPLAPLLASRLERAHVLLEAAHTAMAVVALTEPPRLEAPLAYLREAARDPNQPLRVDVGLSLALVLERSGQREQADATVAEQASSATWAAREQAPDYLARAADADALRALALEREAPGEAARAWRRYLAAPGPVPQAWRAAAEARASRLERGPKPRKRAAPSRPRRER
jgi:tetratricopeptide (TPR) repeat protein